MGAGDPSKSFDNFKFFGGRLIPLYFVPQLAYRFVYPPCPFLYATVLARAIRGETVSYPAREVESDEGAAWTEHFLLSTVRRLCPHLACCIETLKSS